MYSDPTWFYLVAPLAVLIIISIVEEVETKISKHIKRKLKRKPPQTHIMSTYKSPAEKEATKQDRITHTHKRLTEQ